MANPGTLLQPAIAQLGAKMAVFFAYYWEIHEDGKRAEWGYDSVQLGMPPDRAPEVKAVEAQIAQQKELDKVVIIEVFPMGLTGGIPAVIGGLN